MAKSNEEIIAAYRKNQDAHKRYNIKKKILLAKALKAGIKVTEEEIDREMSK